MGNMGSYHFLFLSGEPLKKLYLYPSEIHRNNLSGIHSVDILPAEKNKKKGYIERRGFHPLPVLPPIRYSPGRV